MQRLMKVCLSVVACGVLAAMTTPASAQTGLELPFNGSVEGTRGQTPSLAEGVTFESGYFYQAAAFSAGDILEYPSADNIDSQEGTLEFWFKPNWDPIGDVSHTFLVLGEDNGMVFLVDGLQNLRGIFYRYVSEMQVIWNVSHWRAGEWHHIAFTWSSSQSVLRLYVDGVLIDETWLSDPLPSITHTPIRIGSENGGNDADGLIDELAISTYAKTAEEILSSYLSGRTDTSTQTFDRTGTITEMTILRAYLRVAGIGTLLDDKIVEFHVDGTPVGTAVTGATGSPGRADLEWVITDGRMTRTIEATFRGDMTYGYSTGTASLTAQSWGTKMAPFNRTARITDRTELKARLLRSDNVPLYNKPINFYVDGTFVITRNTNVDGYASYPYYDVPDGVGAGTRAILSEWVGNAGYAPISKTATLTVLKALPYIWVLPRSLPQGAIANLYAYFRRLYDYKKQEGKPVTFRIDGTWIANVVTGSGESEPGVARYFYNTSGLAKGTHTIRCEFAGDAWVEAGYGEATLTVY